MSSVSRENQSSGFLAGLFHLGLYKPSQGRVVRQVTFLAVALVACLVGYDFHSSFGVSTASGKLAVGAIVAAIGAWVGYRAVNFPKFADFLIAVQSELNKVTWPSREQLWRATAVVVFVIFSMAMLLYVFDVIWTFLFQLLNIRYGG